MKKSLTILALVLFTIFLFSCNKDKDHPTNPTEGKAQTENVQGNQVNPKIPPATVKIIDFNQAVKNRILDIAPTLTPADFNVSTTAGQTVCEDKVLNIPANSLPQNSDILFSFDLTGSMTQEVANVAVNSINIMNAIKAASSNAYFGVVSHKDYPGFFNYCSYANTYANPGEFPFALNQPMTGTISTVASVINTLPATVGGGADFPESYLRVFHEAATNPAISFRTGSTKFMVLFLDDQPHDCSLGTGVDPGPDGIAGTSDDITLASAAAELSAAGIKPVVIYSNTDPNIFNNWLSWSTSIGGTAFQINTDGSIPGGTSIASFILNLIQSIPVTYSTVTLNVCDPTYASWVTTNTDVHTNVVLSASQSLDYHICYTVPTGTQPGTYCFDVCAMGDGTVLTQQHVCLTVTAPQIYMDIKPTSCPNPLNFRDNGKLPVAILGSSTFDVSQIDVSTIKLMGVSPVNYAYEDVAGLYTGTVSGCYDCTTSGADGYTDLTLKFNVQDIVSKLSGTTDRECKLLYLTGNLKAQYGGTAFTVSDVVRIQK